MPCISFCLPALFLISAHLHNISAQGGGLLFSSLHGQFPAVGEVECDWSDQ